MALMPSVDWDLELLVKGTEPLRMAEVVEHLKLPATPADLALLQRYAVVARQMAERVTRRALAGDQQWLLILDACPECGEIEFPKPPLRSVDFFKYKGADGTLITWTDYQVSKSAAGADVRRGRLAPNPTVSWPIAGAGYLDPFQITFTCGYSGGGLQAIPEEITHGMLLVIGELYKQRTDSVAAVATTPALIRARDLWLSHRVA